MESALGLPFCQKNDLDILEAVVEKKSTSPEQNAPVRLISGIIVARSSALKMGVRVLGLIFFCHLFLLSKTDDWIRHFLERLKQTLPRPFLEAVVSFYRPPGDDLKWEIYMNSPGKSPHVYLSTDFSICERYSVAGASKDVSVFRLKTLNRLKWLKGHRKNVSVVKFSSDARKVISGSFDNSVIIWDWQKTECPHVILEGHKDVVTSLSLSADASKLFSGSRDGTVKMWNMNTGRLCRNFDLDAEIECVSPSPTTPLLAVGTSDGYLRFTDWVSGHRIFEHRMPDKDTISAVQFGSDGNLLVCGCTSGKATVWRTPDWKKLATVIVRSVTNIAFHPDGTNALLGSSRGEIRHWVVAHGELSKYNQSMARPVNGLSFRSNGDIIAAVKLGYARQWSGPHSNPGLDFENYRNNLLFDFTQSADGTRVATSMHDSMIRVWSTGTSMEIAAYTAPAKGSRRLALTPDGGKIASSSQNGTVRIWKTELPSGNADISFTVLTVNEDSVHCLSFSPEESRLLVCLTNEVQMWSLETRQKVWHVLSFGFSDTCFSSDGWRIIAGNSTRANIWDATSMETLFDTSVPTPQALSLSAAKNTIQTCGPSAHRMSPFSLRVSQAASSPLTVDNMFHFVNHHFRPLYMEFTQDVLVLNYIGVLEIYKLRT